MLSQDWHRSRNPSLITRDNYPSGIRLGRIPDSFYLFIRVVSICMRRPVGHCGRVDDLCSINIGRIRRGYNNGRRGQNQFWSCVSDNVYPSVFVGVAASPPARRPSGSAPGGRRAKGPRTKWTPSRINQINNQDWTGAFLLHLPSKNVSQNRIAGKFQFYICKWKMW